MSIKLLDFCTLVSILLTVLHRTVLAGCYQVVVSEFRDSGGGGEDVFRIYHLLMPLPS